MSNKNKLLTGVVFPLVSLAIAFEPAAASALRPVIDTSRSQVPETTSGNLILVQDAAPSEEELIRRRQQQQEQQEAPAAEPEQRREQPAAEPEPQREPVQEQAPEAEPAPRRQRERAPEPAQEAPAQEAPAEAAPAQQQEQTEPARRPDRARQTDGEQKPDRPRRQEQNSEQQGQRPDRRKPAEDAAPPENNSSGNQEAVPAQKPAAPEPDAQKAPVPTESPAPDKAPAPEAQPNPAPGQQPSEAPRPSRREQNQQQQEQTPETITPAPQDGSTTGQAPAGEVVPDQVATPQQEAPSMTQDQLDAAKAIAEDPGKSSDTVILPVDKGAAVLDSDKEAERSGSNQSREERRRNREQAEEVRVPTSDAEAQSRGPDGKAPPPVEMQAITSAQGERVDRRPRFDRPEGVREYERRDGGGRNRDDGGRIILQFGDRVVVRGDDNERFTRDGGEPYYERLGGGRVRETVERRDGTQVVTIRNRYGDIIQRSRIDDRGREYVLFYAPELMDRPDEDYAYRDPGLDLPPMRLRIPVRDYIIDTTSDPDRDYYEFLDQPPVEPVERVYSLDEVKYSARIRDKVRRIDLDTITFATGSADIPMNQARSLRKVADAINKILEENPAETFLIEGHTDAVGSDDSNLILSDERAESVANVMTDVYGIPPENLATQGYGERYLKVSTLTAEQQNRRVTIRRVTSLVRPVAQN